MSGSRPPLPPFIEPECTALLVIDMQKGFCHPESMMAKSGVGTANQRAIIPDVVRLVRLCRDQEIPVLWSQQIHLPDDRARQRRRLPSHWERQKFGACQRGTWEVDFMDEIAAEIRPEDFVVEKHRASMLFQTTLPAKLRMLGAQILIIAGVNTDFCIESTVREAYFYDHDIVVVRECVAGPRPAWHEDTLAKIQRFFGEVVSLADLPSLFLQKGAATAAR
jgi:ureidoacrylate peracid hydrolase